MGKKSHKKSIKSQFLTDNKAQAKTAEDEQQTENSPVQTQAVNSKVRSSAEIEEQDDVVHDDESPRDPKKFILASESEDDSIKLQEITNTIEDTEGGKQGKQMEDDKIKIIPKELTKLSPFKSNSPNEQINSSNDQNSKIDPENALRKSTLSVTNRQKYNGPKSDLPKGFKEDAIPLITWDSDTQKFKINEEAKNIIKQINGPIGVIAVAGMYRTGKSYLLNRVLLNLKENQGFGVGPTINPCTKGLWIWAKPVVGYSEDGQKVSVIVVDSEGIGGLDEDNNHDSRIFSLALLLSSFFMYNSMGSIDENALSSLSFVTNITELIKTKSAVASGEDQDLVQHMPKFMWVVRDFSLQLVNDDGVRITPGQYLEKALQDVKAEAGDQRNEIKQSLRKYFVQRDCCTLVRPIVDESNLQGLNSVKVEDLRPEFLEQTFDLRSKVLQSMAFKKVNGRKIDGGMWISLAEQYIDQINGGGVPSIESSWTYICRQKAETSFDAAKQNFNGEIGKELQLPVSDRDLEKCVEFYATKYRKDLQKEMMEEVDLEQKYLQQFDNHVQQHFEELKLQNLNECRVLATNTLTQLYAELNQRFMADTSPQNLSQNVKTLDYTLDEIQNLYDSNVHDFSEKYLIFLNAKSSFLNDLVYFVHVNLENQYQSQSKTLNDLQDRNSSSILEAKEALRIEKQGVETKLKETALAKAEVDAALDLLKEKYSALKEQKEGEDVQNDAKIRDLKEAHQRKLEEQRGDKDDYDEKIQNLHRENVKARSGFEKEKALMEQKISYLEKSLEEKTSKEKEYMSNWNSQKSELSSEIRQVCQKYESELKQLNMTLEEEREKGSELEAQLNELQATYKEKTQTWQDQEQRYREMIDRTQDHAKQIESAAIALKNENLNGLEASLKEKTQLLDEITKKYQDLETKFAQSDEELKSKLNQTIKDAAIKDQKVEFLEIQLNETRKQLEDSNKQHQSMVDAMNANNAAVQESKAQADLSDSPSKMDKLDNKISELKAQVQSLQDKSQEYELELSLQASEAERLQRELQNKIDDLELQKSALQAKIKSHDLEKSAALEQIEAKYSLEVKKLEQELEEKQASGETHVKSIQSRSEESLAQLKAFFEGEKEKQEQRLREEREKAQKKVEEYQEEIESKMRDEFIEKEEELEMIRQNFQDLEQRHNQQATQSQHEISLKEQTIENLESQSNDQKKRIEMIESTRNQAFEKQLQFFEQQRQEYNTRIDKLQSDNLDKDRQLAQLQHKQERVQEDGDRKTRDLAQNIEHLTRERDQLNEKNENLKKKLSDTQDEAQQSQLVFGRDQALSQQSIEFLQRKIQEMQSTIEDKTNAYEAKLQSMRIDLQEEGQGNVERIQNERDMWEQKYEQKRRALKEIEQQLNREVAELEKKVCVLQENCQRLDQEKRSQEAEFQEKLQEYELQIQNLDHNADQAYQYGNVQTETVLQYKTTIQELERALSDAQSTYDKEKALWEGRCQFLVNQKETYKKDLNESTRKFEITLEQLQKRGSTAQDRHELDQSALAKGIEQKYQTKIKEMLESHTCLQSEMQNKIKRVEEENKKLGANQSGTFKELEREKMKLEKSFEELQRSYEAQQVDCEELKEDRERKLGEFQRQAQKDKEMQRARVAEAENKLNESNQKRNQMVFEIEKERARWQIQYDSIVANKRELEDIIQNLERRRDLLFKENERLKAEVKSMQQAQSDKSNTSISSSKLGKGIGQSLGQGLYNTSLNARKGSKTDTQHQQMMGLKGIQNGLNGKFSTGAPGQSSLGDQNSKYLQLQFQSNGTNTNHQTMNNRYGDPNAGPNSASMTDHSASFSHQSHASQDLRDVNDVMNVSQTQSTYQPQTQVPQPLPQPQREVPNMGSRQKSGEARKNQTSNAGIGSSLQLSKGKLKNQLTSGPQLGQSASQQQMQMRLSFTNHSNVPGAFQKKTSTRYN